MKTVLTHIVTHHKLCNPALDIIASFDKNDTLFLTKLCDMLFRVYSDHKMFEEALVVYDYMEQNGLVIEERSCFVLLLALKKSGDLDLLMRFFRKLVDSGKVEIKVQSLTIVIDVLCQKREVERAKALMDEMVGKGIVEPNVFTYNTLLKAYIARKDQKGVTEILSLMKKRQVAHNLITCDLLIQWYGSSGDIEEAEELFKNMRGRGIEPDVYVYTSLINWTCRHGNLKRAFALFDEAT